MGKVLISESKLTAIGDAIRAKEASSGGSGTVVEDANGEWIKVIDLSQSNIALAVFTFMSTEYLFANATNGPSNYDEILYQFGDGSSVHSAVVDGFTVEVKAGNSTDYSAASISYGSYTGEMLLNTPGDGHLYAYAKLSDLMQVMEDKGIGPSNTSVQYEYLSTRANHVVQSSTDLIPLSDMPDRIAAIGGSSSSVPDPEGAYVDSLLYSKGWYLSTNA